MSSCKYFQRIVLRIFSKFGFAENGRSLIYNGNDVDIIINVQSTNNHCFINMGFIIHAIGDVTYKKVEKTHMYFRLERIFPEYRDIITSASEIGEGDFQSKFEIFINLVDNVLARKLCELTELSNLKKAYLTGIFRHGLLTPDARYFFSTS